MSMKVKLFGVVGALVLFGATTSAEARRHEWSDRSGWEDSESRQEYRRYRSREASERRYYSSDDDDEARPRRAYRKQRKHRTARKPVAKPAVKQAELGSFRGLGPRPGAWCGWWMRSQKGGGPEYNLAWNWSRRGQPTEPKVGAIVVWRHHVGEITGRTKSGQWIVRSGNDGGRVRERPRSVAGAVFRML
jgi:hypothetical protein